jgi:hypothetical protein
VRPGLEFARDSASDVLLENNRGLLVVVGGDGMLYEGFHKTRQDKDKGKGKGKGKGREEKTRPDKARQGQGQGKRREDKTR